MNWSYGLSALNAVDDVVAIAPGVRVGDVDGLARALGVAGDVEPVAAPALAEARRREQPVHHLLERFGRRVRDERLHLLGRRRQAGQVEVDAAEERALVGVADRLQPLLGQLREQEGVDRHFGFRISHFGFPAPGAASAPRTPRTSGPSRCRLHTCSRLRRLCRRAGRARPSSPRPRSRR